MFIPPVLLAAASILGLFHSLIWPGFEKETTLVDLLEVVVAVSGITVTVIVAYLSLGRALDVFSNAGDVIPFWLYKHNVPERDIDISRLMAAATVDTKEYPEIKAKYKEYAKKLDAFFDLGKLGSASARHLDHKKKILLVPPELRMRYDRFFKDEVDEWALRRYVWIVGLPALACVAALFLGHYNSSNMLLVYFRHVVVIFCSFANILAFSYLIRIGRLRFDLERGIFFSLESLCASVNEIRDELKLLASANLNAAVLGLVSQVEEAKKQPDLFNNAGSGI
ncbi:MAG TPA: hypothetical protein VGF56_12220 [Rhizomicrobium sp.]|jgi:hypothetical protein